MIRLIGDGENLLRPHRRHIYQLLANEKGIAHWKVSLGYGLTQSAVGLSVLWVMSFGFVAVLFLLAFYFVAFALFGGRVRQSAKSKAT